ncbi:hypothetical protein LOCC1_G006241 [Lachnellula occidentalis]|uniref:BZIP domain-containing protein n=1 Tax=Lachnellula occidentalis TaxID=215460 RepID=A0A8H8RNY0_9HELO|nr:hypothetical protein LOCC1_G006241 [Lachnellula occidentalis]
MSSARSSASPPAVEAEPRKKGSRGGKRSVTHLSKAQLARKRANDREAQRNIRQRTKEHIETLEKKVKELEEYNRSGSMDRVIKRNKELEEEVENLRSQIALQQSPPITADNPQGTTTPDDMTDEMLIPRKGSLEWSPESEPCPWPGAVSHDIVGSNGTYASSTSQQYPPESAALSYNNQEMGVSQQIPTSTAAPVWSLGSSSNGSTVTQSISIEANRDIKEDPVVFCNPSQPISQPLSQSTPAWTSLPTAFSQPSRFTDLQPSGFTNVLEQPTISNATCWQSQPSIYAWQISTKLKAPVTITDQLFINVIQSQRHLVWHGGDTEDGVEYPSVNILFNQPGSFKPPSSLTEIMARYSAILSHRGFPLIPEKLASFMCMYRFVQWQISPTYETYKRLHDWQTPRPCQLIVPHPAWMDLPPWGEFREKVIGNQARYDNLEFQTDYGNNFSVNFLYDPLKALIFENGQIMASPLMERHITDISNMSMKKPFADKYPEFKDVCRFDEV